MNSYFVLLRRPAEEEYGSGEVIRVIIRADSAYDAIVAALVLHKGWIAAGVEACTLAGYPCSSDKAKKRADTGHTA